MKLKNKIALIFVVTLLTFIACVKDDTPNTIKPESMEWMYQGDIGDTYTMYGNTSINDYFVLNQSYGYDRNTAYTAVGLDIDLSSITDFTQKFNATYTTYTIGLSDNYPPFGNEFNLSIAGVFFTVDLAYHKLTRVSFEENYRALSAEDDDYYSYGVPMLSTVTFLDSITINNVDYADVMHIEYNDFASNYTDFTIREIFIAKGFGIVKIVRNNGDYLER